MAALALAAAGPGKPNLKFRVNGHGGIMMTCCHVPQTPSPADSTCRAAARLFNLKSRLPPGRGHPSPGPGGDDESSYDSTMIRADSEIFCRREVKMCRRHGHKTVLWAGCQLPRSEPQSPASAGPQKEPPPMRRIPFIILISSFCEPSQDTDGHLYLNDGWIVRKPNSGPDMNLELSPEGLTAAADLLVIFSPMDAVTCF